MKRISFTIAAVMVASISFATNARASDDNFHFERDKQIHFGGSIAMGALANIVTDNPWKAFAGCSAVGAAIELLPKVTGHGVASYQDFAYDAAGCAIGAYTGFKIKGLVLAPRRGGVRVAYVKQF